jgi:hypothetical protein
MSQTAQVDRFDETDAVETVGGYAIRDNIIYLNPDPFDTESGWHSVDQVLTGNLYVTARTFEQPHRPFAEAHWGAEPFESPFERNFRNRLAHLSISSRWWRDGISPPSQNAKEKAFQVFKHLADTRGIVPDQIDASIEGGITFSYRNYGTGRSMVLEVYNGLEVAGIVNEGATIIYSDDVEDLDFTSLILAFKEESRT